MTLLVERVSRGLEQRDSEVVGGGDEADPFEALSRTVGLEFEKGWSVDRTLLKQYENNFEQARNKAWEIACAANPAEKRSAFELLHRLFELDPLTMDTSSGLIELIENLSDRIKEIDKCNTEQQESLITVYASAIECLISHFGIGHIRGIAEEVQKGFLEAPNLLERLNEGHNLRIQLCIDYGSEGAKRLKTDKDIGAFLPTAISLIKLAWALATADYGGAKEQVLELWGQFEEERKLSWRDWFEKVYIIRGFRRDGVSPTSSVHIIDKLSRFILKQSSERIGIFEKVLHPTLRKKCPWQVLISAAEAYAHILLHSSEEKFQQVYQQAISIDPQKPGLLAILLLAQESQGYAKVERGLVEIVEMLIKKGWIERLDQEQGKAICGELLDFADHLKSQELAERLINRVENKLKEIKIKKQTENHRAIKNGFHNFPVRKFHKMLFQAMQDPCCSVIKCHGLIEQGAHPAYYLDEQKNTALHIAAKREDPACFQECLKRINPQDLELKNKREETPLSIAITKGVSHMQAILQVYADREHLFNGMSRPLHDAIVRGSLEEVRCLIALGQPVDQVLEGVTPLARAVKQKQFVIGDFLMKSGANLRSQEMIETFHLAILEGDLESVKFFLEKGMKANEPVEGTLPLFSAVSCDRFDIAKVILKAVEIDEISPKEGLNPLHWAIINGKKEGVSFLLREGASVHIKTKLEQSPFELAENLFPEELKHEIKRLLLKFHKEERRERENIDIRALGSDSVIAIKTLRRDELPRERNLENTYQMYTASHRARYARTRDYG